MEILKQINSFLPKYKTTLPFCKKEVIFVPFRVKDAKNIATILQEQNRHLAFIAMIDIVKRNCENINPNDLCLADAEYLFLQIRSKSVDETLNLIYNKEKIQVNISEIKPINEIQEQQINIGNDISIVVKTPTIKNLLKLKNTEKEDFIKASIKNVILKNEIYDCSKFVPEELKEILANLPLSIITKLDDFLKKEPQLKLEVNTSEGKKEASGLLNFFTYR
jgi:hypothetical protein